MTKRYCMICLTLFALSKGSQGFQRTGPATALKNAGLSGRNPYLGKNAAKLRTFQQSLKYHTTADWDTRTREEIRGAVPEEMKKWLKDVRGY